MDELEPAPLDQSAALVQLQTQIDSGDPSALASFWLALREGGTPLVESIADSPQEVLVTFVYRSQTATYVVIPTPPELMKRPGDPRTMQLSRLPGTDLWARSYRLPVDARFPYSFGPDLPLTPPPRDEKTYRWLLRADPLNHHRVGFRQSLCVLPKAPISPLTEPASDVPVGVVRVHKITSRRLGNDRRIYVYTPPGHDQEAGPYPLVVLFDGLDYLSSTPTPTILDNLIAQKRLPPTVALMIDPVDREGELSLSAPFTEVVACEIVPFVQRRYRASADPSAVVVGGISAGGVGAAWAAFCHPEVFGKVLAQSDAGFPLPSGEDVYESLARQVAEAPPRSIRFLLEDCRIGEANPLGSPAMPFRHLHPVLTAKGYPVTCRTFAGGHHMTSSRVRLGDALAELLEGVRPQPATPRQPTDDLHIEDLGPSLSVAVLQAGALGGTGGAERALRQRLAHSRDCDESLLKALGFELLYAAEQPPAAVAAFEERLERFPPSADAYNSLAEAWYVAGDRAKAIASYQKALELDPHDENALHVLEELLRRRG